MIMAEDIECLQLEFMGTARSAESSGRGTWKLQ